MSNPHPNKPIKTASLRTTKTPIHQEDGHDFAKDLREAGLVYAFSKCCPDVEIRDFQQLDDSNGAPDFQIVVAEERIGLEVTNYVRPKELSWKLLASAIWPVLKRSSAAPTQTWRWR